MDFTSIYHEAVCIKGNKTVLHSAPKKFPVYFPGLMDFNFHVEYFTEKSKFNAPLLLSISLFPSYCKLQKLWKM